MRTPSIVQKGWFIPAVFFAIAIPLALALMGLNRPYDAIPDQDLLWASEALRLHSGRGPSYADHPGIYWTLSYLLKLIHLPKIGINFLNGNGYLTPDGAKSLIQISRIENGILCGLCSVSFIPIMRCLSISRKLTLAGIFMLTCSTGLLTAVSEIRNEMTSTLLMTIYINLNLLASQLKNNSKSPIPNPASIGLALIAIPCFFAAAFCKQQVLLATPLIFAAALAANKGSLQAITTSLSKQPRLAWLAFLLIGLLPWLLSATPDIDLINAPFWIGINLGLWITLSATSSLPQTGKNLWQLGGFVAVTEIVVMKFLVFNWWRQAITGFPSWMFSNANHKDQMRQGVTALLNYCADIFSSGTLGIALITLVFLLLIRDLFIPKSRQQAISKLFILTSSSALLLASTARYAVRYELYFMPPLMIGLMAIAGKREDQINSHSLSRLTSFALIGLISLHSLTNSLKLPAFVNKGQPRSFLCFGQHMDHLMKLTSAGSCPNFAEASADKNGFDPYSGP